ncbi:collagenase [Montanilutibacter psychrotolerans]|uniref:microbial collagenase n=1 Tax=Montanilutibacter psychrotolerans TaxID=1327343 RepID=A0A3M8SUI0_9GAMM|nr:collagenase [Lysobacter psychrotolerans]RNF82382.1 PKD domain-containing protein [Lysobacter psychrotolerans]
MQISRRSVPAWLAGTAAAAAVFLSYAATSGRTETRGVAPSVQAGTTAAASQLIAARTNAAGRLVAGITPSTERQVFGDHVQQRPLPPNLRIPLQPSEGHWLRTGTDTSAQRANLLSRPSVRTSNGRSALTAAAACDVNRFGALSGAALVTAIKTSETGCINELFGLKGAAAQRTFNEAKMVTVANGLRTASLSYDGTNAGSTLQLVLFMRAGYYVQFYDDAVGNYGSALTSAVRGALDAYIGNANFGRIDNVHGEVLAEVVTLIDSSGENARYLSTVSRLLDGYNTSYNAHYWMKAAVNNAYTVLFRGHDNDAFRAAVQANSAIVDTLNRFVTRHFAQLGGEQDYLVANAGREMGRFLQYDGALRTKVRPLAKSMLDRSQITGNTAKLWMGVGEMVDFHDKANCSYYQLCDYTARIDAAVLPVRHQCSSTLRIRAQALTAAELAQSCATVAGQEAYFHQQLATAKRPVANDNNSALEMVVFRSSDDYGTYAGALYGIDTNNGGMYLEGNPSRPGNQARFIAYQAEWLLPKFEIWNLTHEYVHYLDGRFDMFGDFQAAMSQKTVWWVEGLAEYLSYSYRKEDYVRAREQAATGAYKLSQIHGNDYASGSTRVYQWGYLAVRYMFEKRHGDVDSILGYFRPGNYTGYGTFMAGIGTRYDQAFAGWLPCAADPQSTTCGNTPPVASFTAVTSGTQVLFRSTATDANGRVASQVWDFGDGTSSTLKDVLKTYSSPGTYQAKLTVTDDHGASHTQVRAITVVRTLACPASDVRVLGRNCMRSGLSAAAGQTLYFYIQVPAGVKRLSLGLTGASGGGNPDLYVSTTGWASPASFTHRSATNNKIEQVVLTNPAAGYVYVSVHARTAITKAVLRSEY